MQVHLRRIQVRFVYEGDRIKAKVTGMKCDSATARLKLEHDCICSDGKSF